MWTPRVATIAAKTRTSTGSCKFMTWPRQLNSSVSLVEKWSQRQKRRLWLTYLITEQHQIACHFITGTRRAITLVL